jgi:solute carrier family 25 (mitochondrial carnitine/acylcarnitine transporter), member 20/29
MQTGAALSLSSCIGKTFRADGLRGFFYGISSPLYSIPVVNAVVFGAYAQANTIFSIESSFWKGIVSGSYAGLVNTLVVTPVELIKIKMQVQSHDASLGTQIKYSSPWACTRSTLKEEGLRGFYKGGVCTVLREIPGYAMQFASFEATKSMFQRVIGSEELSMVHVFVAGMVGGFCCWFFSYPQDVIKTKIQAGHKVVKGWDGGMWYLSKEIWRTEGWIGFWRGFSACFFRATIPNGVGFLVNDRVMTFLLRYNSDFID